MSSNSTIHSPNVDRLLVLCEEVMRATPEGAKRFIEPAPGVLARAKSMQHNIVFGRRGSGKSSLLRKIAADLTIDRRPMAFVDMETFKGHTYPDVLISVLIKSLRAFDEWLTDAATAPANKTSFWQRLFGTSPTRPPFDRRRTKQLSATLQRLIEDLERQLQSAEAIATTATDSVDVAETNGSSAEAGIAATPATLKAGAQRDVTVRSRAEVQRHYVSHKVEYLHQHILRFQQFFSELQSVSGGPAYLILDDLYHIRKSDQAKVIDYFHRIAKGHGLWLKIGTIKHRSQWYQHSDPPIGVKLGDDAKEINLDISLEKFETLREFLKRVLEGLVSECSPLTTRDIMNQSTIDRLTIASGGVVRDFIGIFAGAINQARNRPQSDHRGPRVGVEDVNLAAGDYDPQKREEFKLDTAEDRDQLEREFQKVVEFCTERSKCNVLLVSQKLSGPLRDAIDQLIDLRLIHMVKTRVTLKRGAAGELFEAHMLDLSQYTAARKVHEFEIVDLGSSARDETIRRSSLIYGGRSGSDAKREKKTSGSSRKP